MSNVKKLLRKIEWSSFQRGMSDAMHLPGPLIRCCPDCGGLRPPANAYDGHVGHRDACELKKILEK